MKIKELFKILPILLCFACYKSNLKNKSQNVDVGVTKKLFEHVDTASFTLFQSDEEKKDYSLTLESVTNNFRMHSTILGHEDIASKLYINEVAEIIVLDKESEEQIFNSYKRMLLDIHEMSSISDRKKRSSDYINYLNEMLGTEASNYLFAQLYAREIEYKQNMKKLSN